MSVVTFSLTAESGGGDICSGYLLKLNIVPTFSVWEQLVVMCPIPWVDCAKLGSYVVARLEVT